MTMSMALNLLELMIEDHHPNQSDRYRVRPMTKGYSLRDMKREMRVGGGQKACKNPPEMALKLFDLFDLVMTTKPPEFLETYSEPFS